MKDKLDVDILDQRLTLLPERAVWWGSRRALLLSDVHLGKGHSFRRLGMGVPAGTSAADLKRIGNLIKRFDAETVWVLGDLIHAEIDRQLRTSVADWREQHADVTFRLVLGNHDRRLHSPPPEWQIEVIEGEAIVAGIRLRHEPTRDACAEISGHVHPVVKLRAGRGDRMTARAFLLRQSMQLWLPAFGDFTGGYVVKPETDDRVFVVGGGTVIEMPN